MNKNFCIAFGFLIFTGCSTLSTPVLRHETGDTLGAGNTKVVGGYETARMYGLIPSTSAASGIAQDSGVLRSSLMHIGVRYGVLPTTDLQLNTYFKLGGAGWRLGAKRELFKWGSLHFALILGYGSHVGKGTVSYSTTAASSTSTSSSSTTGGNVDVEQTLGAKQLDFGIPLSYAFSDSLTVYGGFTYYSTSVTGVADTEAVKKSFGDMGFNLGVRFPAYGLEWDIEGAMLSASDPTGGGMMPHFGLGVGMPF